MFKISNSAPRLPSFLVVFLSAVLILFLYRILSIQEIVYSPTNYSPPFEIEYIEQNLYNLDQTDPHLIQYTRIKHLTPPSKLPYNLVEKGNYKDGFSSWVADFFGNKVKV